MIVGLSIFCLISFFILFGQENNTQINIDQNPQINRMFGNISNELNQSSGQADASRQALIDEEKNPVLTTLGFVFRSILSTLNTFTSMGLNMFNYIFVFIQTTLGISPVILGVLSAILIGTIILAIWSTIRAGR